MAHYSALHYAEKARKAAEVIKESADSLENRLQDLVTRTTKQQITGEKIYTRGIIRKGNYDSTQTPALHTEDVIIEARDLNGALNASFRVGRRDNGDIEAMMYSGKGGKTHYISTVTCPDGSGYSKCTTPPPNSTGKQIITGEYLHKIFTSSQKPNEKSEFKSSYMKFENGFIIQTGYAPKGDPVEVIFDTPFQTTDYAVVMNTISTDAEYYARLVTEKRTTGFTMRVGGGAMNKPFNWIAIGF